MNDEYIYDTQRIIMVLVVIAVIVGAGSVAYLAWPQPQPKIGDMTTQLNLFTDNETISVKYNQIFNASVNTNDAVMLKIYIAASTLYYMTRMTISAEVGDDVEFLALAVAKASNEAIILTGKNDFVVGQSTYSNILTCGPDNYVVYIFLIVQGEMDFYYNIRVGE